MAAGMKMTLIAPDSRDDATRIRETGPEDWFHKVDWGL
jgi:hypothetical protein